MLFYAFRFSLLQVESEELRMVHNDWVFGGLVSAGAYLLGSVPAGVILSRLWFGLDVRDLGSGNIGATNVARVFGVGAGIFTFAFDFFKGVLAVGVATLLSQNPWITVSAGLAVVVGHCFSLFLRFDGGKGVATSLGCLLLACPWVAFLSGGTYLIFLGMSRIGAVGSLAGLGAVLLYSVIFLPPWPDRVLLWGLSFVILIRHRANIVRLATPFIERFRGSF